MKPIPGTLIWITILCVQFGLAGCWRNQETEGRRLREGDRRQKTEFRRGEGRVREIEDRGKETGDRIKEGGRKSSGDSRQGEGDRSQEIGDGGHRMARPILDLGDTIGQGVKAVPVPAGSSPGLFKKMANLRVLPQDLSLDSSQWSSFAPPLTPQSLYRVKSLIIAQVNTGVFHASLPQAMDLYWESSGLEARMELLFHLFQHLPLSRSSLGLPAWRLNTWMSKRNLSIKEDLSVLEIFLSGEANERAILRDYLTEKYAESFGSNYLFWRKYLRGRVKKELKN